jgi:fatty-acyl-CoA synthase
VRSRKLANALDTLSTQPGARIGTLAWNGHRHMELYYAVSGSGRVLHTLNPRLHADQLRYIVDHAEDQVLFFDLTFLPLVEAIAGTLKTCKIFVAMTDRAHMPATQLDNVLCYEDLVDAHSDRFAWPQLDENLASSLCYTSGTTGNPKGVLYSHRSTVLHTYAAALPDALSSSACDVILPVVPMFHVNAWGLPYVACMTGAKLVFPGPALDGKSLYELFEAEQVTLSAGVPTVWQGLLTYVEANGLQFSSMRRTIIGGAACPPVMMRSFQSKLGVKVLHAWGMTELSPVGTVCNLKPVHLKLTDLEREGIQAKQGRVVFGVDMKIVGNTGEELPWDGKQSGELLVRGPWIVQSYFKNDGGDPLVDGWFPTGDVATIDADGFMQITDRAKDVIKSGGEWIGSIDIENIAMGHPSVAMAACIAAYHPKWDERPLLLVVLKPGQTVTRDELLAFFDGKIAKWWTPDDVVFVDAIPLGATGKMLKHKLRDMFRGHQLPTA